MSPIASSQTVNVKPRSRWAVILPWLLVLLFAVSNLGTLISAQVHSVGFRAVESVLRLFGPDVGERLLARSTPRIADRQARLVRAVAARTAGRLATHAARSIATIPERVVPVFGTVAVVGFTIYDVHTDCAIAGEMNEILASMDQDQIDAGSICRLAEQVPSPSGAWALARESANGAQRKAMDLLQQVLGSPK